MALAYTAPTWENGGGVGISASQLQALSDCMEGLVQGSDKAITNIAISGQTITLTFADGSQESGTASGLKGISSIAKTGTSGNVDTYTITYTDGSTSTFTVTNGADGSFYIVTAGIKSTDDPYGNIEYYIGGDFYKNGVLYNQSAFYKVTLVNETEYPPSPYLIDDSSGTFTNGHYSTGSIGGIPSGATITTQIFTDSTMATLLGEVKVLIGLRGSEGEQGPAGDDGVSPEVTITTITGGHRVKITDATHPQGQSFDVMDGAGSGDMQMSVYDSDGDVANAGGIPAYVAEHSGGIDGSTVTPTDVVATWLECAGLHQSYTTIGEVLADSGVLYALINSTNAVDYMVRSTTWASSVCANQTAMNYIGNNNYCADTLIANSTWKNALVNSAYADEVLTVVPATTSASTEVGASSYYSDLYAPWKAFDQNMPSGNFWGWAPSNSDENSRIWYHFPEKIKVKKFAVYMRSNTGTASGTSTGKLIGSNDGTNWTEISDLITVSTYNTWFYFDTISNDEYEYIGVDFITFYNGSGANGVKLQFYGRSDLPPVDDRINAKADISAIGTNETGATASKAYAVGEHFYKNGKFCTAKAAIASGAIFTLNTNYVEGTIADNTPFVITITNFTIPKNTATDYDLSTYLPTGKTIKSLLSFDLLNPSDPSHRVYRLPYINASLALLTDVRYVQNGTSINILNSDANWSDYTARIVVLLG